MSFATCYLPHNNLFALTYKIPKDINLKVGDLVMVPYRNSSKIAIVSALINSAPTGIKLKAITSQLEYSISPKLLQLISSAAEYYLAEIGTFARLALPVDLSKNDNTLPEHNIDSNKVNLPELNEAQQQCLKTINTSNKLAHLVKGVTGSGKTEVYFHYAWHVVQQGQQVLLLLPEIGLAHQISQRFTQRFGFEAALWHSGITPAKKRKTLKAIMAGTVKVVIGTRSSLFLPYHNLGLIVVDEEHDASYKQVENTCYNARDMAVLRSHIEGVNVLLTSATPSLESIRNCQIGKYQLHQLSSRYGNFSLPNIQLVDMRSKGNKAEMGWLSDELTSAITDSMQAKKQTLLFINRRGYAPLLLCKACGFRLSCEHCSSNMVYHKKSNLFTCHHCGHTKRNINQCPECNEEDSLLLCGPAIERIAEQVTKLFPEANIATISRQSSSEDVDHSEIIESVKSGAIDILIGTQMITKGYHFPKLNLVGIIDADMGSSINDLKTAERMFQLLMQVSGRAGREQNNAKVIMQTHNPTSKILTAIKYGNEEDFINYELAARKQQAMPPFARSACLMLSSKNNDSLYEYAARLVQQRPKTKDNELKMLGPVENVMHKLKGRYRYNIMLIAPRNYNLQAYMRYWLNSFTLPNHISMKLDIE